MIYYNFVRVSRNNKTGPIPVSTTAKESCPDTCAFKASGCYAKSGPINIHWSRLSKQGLTREEFLEKIKQIPRNQLWRHNQAGDLPHKGGKIDFDFLKDLTVANHGKKGFTYTHHTIGEENIQMIKWANQNGFTVNLSANNIDEAIELAKTGLPIVTVVSSKTDKKHFNYRGANFMICPATYRDKIQCANCKLCQKSNRKWIVAFPAHGIRKKSIDSQLEKI